MDKLWAMQVFTRVVECGNFSRAAESLDIANATVTASVRNLETFLGTSLLSRNTRTLRLTDAGEKYFKQCVELLQRVESMESEVREEKSTIQGMLKIEAPAAFARTLICPKLAEFLQQHPGLSVAVRQTDHPEGLIESGTDVAIRFDSVDDADLVARPLYQAHYVACITPSLLEQIGPLEHPSQLPADLCLGLFRRERYRPASWEFRRGDEQVEIEPEGKFHFNGTDALIEEALHDRGLIYVLDVFVNKLISDGKLVELFSDWRTRGRDFYTVTPLARFVEPRTRSFIEFMMQTLDEQRRPSPQTQIRLHPGRR